MLILIVNKFLNEKTNRWEELVDYAVDSETGMNVCVPNNPIGSFPNVKYHQDMGEWVIE